MTATETKPKATPQQGYEVLCRLMAPKFTDKMTEPQRAAETATKADVQKKVMAHLRAVTGLTIALPVFHNNADFSDDDKIAFYKDCVSAIVHREWHKLKGQVGVGDKRVESPASDAAPIVSAPQEPPAPTVPAPVNPDSVIEIKESDDDLTKAILKRIIPRLPKGGVDADAVKQIVRSELPFALPDIHDEVKKALSNGSFPVERVKNLIAEAIKDMGVQRIAIISPTGEVKEVGRQHYKFGLLMACVSQRLCVMLVGPAGGGKTTGAAMVAKALDMKFGAMSLGPMTSKADFYGYKDATGEYHTTLLAQIAEQGGVMLLDEWDAAHAGCATYTNMLLANEEFATPIGMKQKHKDFILIAGANTFGQGADRLYVGRNQLDAATLDRFVVIDWDYDEGLEASLIGLTKPSPTFENTLGGILEPDQWFARVTAIRQAVETLKVRAVISPRATVHGVKLFDAGIGQTHVENMVIWKGMDIATRQKIENAL
ncbi:AAA family ATPase [Pedosphaera parvula]|uniref:ATPase associated with various cellular activities AAA_5 n=1 Tax=Pedosphaera parvula (strain Ellin514) TaxID=320771 RepID=B9XA14_PEDPL|nr:AAA family ATPase [Pedosphaera parvula]EEF63355.1 ATPase associated with various cellular activities AAA_5 [Pedosphaera parvula Ellin514]